MIDVIDGIFYSYKGYEGIYGYSKEDDVYYGKISNTNDLILFEGRNLTELYQSFEDSVDEYIEIQKEIEKNKH